MRVVFNAMHLTLSGLDPGFSKDISPSQSTVSIMIYDD
jgi:hypothetical protein